VHRIAYANDNTVPSILNPSLPFCALVKNTTNNTPIVIKSSSVGAFIEGKINGMGIVKSANNTKTSVGTTQTNILTIRNKVAYQGLTNRSPIELILVSISSDGSKTGSILFTINAQLGGTPSYSDINTNTSTVEIDTAGTTVSGGSVLSAFSLRKTDSIILDITNFPSTFLPGDTLTVSAAANSATTDFNVSLTWIDKL